MLLGSGGKEVRHGWQISALAVLASSCLAPPANADVKPDGLPLGGFRLYPTVDLAMNYDDNIYRTDATKEDDWFLSVGPGVSIESNWIRHQLGVFANLSRYRYSSHSSESHTDWTAGGFGQLDITQGVQFSGRATYSILHEARTSPDQPLYAEKPTTYALTQANAALSYHPYHFGFSLGGTFVRYVYDPTVRIGSAPLDNTDRNRNEVVGFAKGSYEFSPGYATFLQASYRDVSYDIGPDRSGLFRSNNGYSLDCGLDMLVTDLIRGQAFVGYLNERYHAPLPDVSGLNFGAALDWSPSAFWTVHLAASRLLNGTTIYHASTEDDQSVRVGVDYFVLTDMTIKVHAAYQNSKFNGSPRTDKYVEGGGGAEYTLGPKLTVSLAYTYQTRDSTVAGQDFNDNLVRVGLNIHL